MRGEGKTNGRTMIPLPLGPRPGHAPVPPSSLIPHPSSLLDGFGRKHTNLRVSVTDRCNLRCTYCMPEDVTFLPRAELLTFEEIAAFVRVAAGLGVDKVRLTGGEPLLRRGVPELVRMIVAVPGIADVGLTTNGLLLERFAGPLWDAGLRRLNVSLDTLDPGRFRELARRDGVEQVVAGLRAAKAAGFGPVKVNAVAVRGFVERDAVPLARFCRDHGFELRFIEYMPIGADPWERSKVVPAAELLGWLRREVGELVPAAAADPHAPATDWDYADGGGRVGVIPSVSAPFCGTCNRLRLTADGKLRNCLFALDETDVKPLLRPMVDADAMAAALRASVGAKWAGHGFNAAGYVKPDRTMHAIGG
jgi:cyclic pyranopterin phosphate synthase